MTSTPTTATATVDRDARTLTEVACDLAVAEHRLRDARRWTPEGARTHLDAALASVSTALDCLHAEHQRRTTSDSPTGPQHGGAPLERGPPVSTHIEWLDAAETSVSAFAPGEEWVGAGNHRRPVLTLAQDDIVAFEGTPAELRALAARITAVVAADTRLDAPSR